MTTETFLQRENAAINPVFQQTLPTKSKHDSDETHREANAMAIYQRDLRKLDGTEIKLYDNKKIQLAEIFNTKKAVANEIKEQIKNGGLKYVPPQYTARIAA